MALILADRVQETTTTTGTTDFALGGAVTGFQTFLAGIGNANTCYYTAILPNSSEWEVGIGTVGGAGAELVRTTVLASSNSGSKVSFSTGQKFVFVTYPAEKSVNLDASGNVSALGTISSGVWHGTAIADTYLATISTAGKVSNSATTATNANTASAIVARDASGNFSAGTITANLTGNASTVTNGVYTTGDQTIGGTKTFSSTITGSVSGNAGTVTNGVYTSGSYSDPTWITSLAGSKVSGDISGNAANVTGTVAILNGGTGQTTASAAFNALSPITTTGDLILGNGTNSATRLAIGANTYLLTSDGTTASWQAPPAAGVTQAKATALAMIFGL